MKYIDVRLPHETEFVKIYPFSGWHIGDTHCDLNGIREMIAEVQADKNAYVICNGDLMNNATKTSVSDCYAETIPPMQQINLLTELLKPIKDRILMFTQGNHEARTYRTDGIDLTAIVANNLGALDRYAREGGLLFLRVGTLSRKKSENKQVSYTIYCTHGSGGGRKEGAKAIRLADMASIIDADIYIHSHTHLPMIMKQSFFRVDRHNCTGALVEKLFVNTAAQLEYGGYGQSGEFKPSTKSNPTILLGGRKKTYKAKL